MYLIVCYHTATYISLITIVTSHITVLALCDFFSVNYETGSIRRGHLKENSRANKNHINLSSLITHDKLHYRSRSFNPPHGVCMREFQIRVLTTPGRIHIFISLYLPTTSTLYKSRVITNLIY